MSTENAIYLIMAAIYIVFKLVRRAIDSNIQNVLNGPTKPSAPQAPLSPTMEPMDYEPSMPTPSFAPIAPDPSFEPPIGPTFTHTFQPSISPTEQPTEQELYPGYAYQPIDIPEPQPEADSPLQPVEHRPNPQPNDEPMHPLLSELLAEGFDPTKAIIYADIIAPRYNYF